jgi:chromosome segregation ATPase
MGRVSDRAEQYVARIGRPGLIARIRRSFEPLAFRLLEWCRSVDARMQTAEARLDRADGRLTPLEDMSDEFRRRLSALEQHADQTHWGREALVERMNVDDAREQQIIRRIEALEARAEQLHWAREALVERLNATESQGPRPSALVVEIEARAQSRDERQTGVELDLLAVSRRLASIEEHIEKLLPPAPALGATDEGEAAPLVAFRRDKAAG